MPQDLGVSRQHAQAKSRSFLSLTLPCRNANISIGSVQVSYAVSVMSAFYPAARPKNPRNTP
jgi:hypothetical protein